MNNIDTKFNESPVYKDKWSSLYMGDSLHLLKLVPDESVDLIFADPPYFLSNGGISCSGGKQVSVNKGSWDKGMSLKDKYEFNKAWISECYRILRPSGTIWISGSFHNIYLVGTILEELNFRILNNITWQKTNPPPNLACRTFTHSTETVLWAKKNTRNAKHYFNYQLMKKINDNKQMKDVWTGSLTRKSEKSEGKHPTQKPEYLLERIILASSRVGDTVLDPFTGSGTTNVVCKRLGRFSIGFDAEEQYLKIAENRLRKVDGYMENRNFEDWLAGFKDSIYNYSYFVNFEKVYTNVADCREELEYFNCLIGSENIEKDFISLMNEHPEIYKAIPVLIAWRKSVVKVTDESGVHKYNFGKNNNTPKEYACLLRKTGVFELLESNLVSSVVDYALGIEAGLDSNGRKNRSGHLMEDLVESYIIKAGFKLGEWFVCPDSNVEVADRDSNNIYYKEMYLSEVENAWDLDLSQLSNDGKTEKRFDFVVKTSSCVYAIETNFYSGGGSKLNETARSYKMLAEESKNIDGFKFVWFTDGKGWRSARNNLRETFEVLDTVYCIDEIENDVMKAVFK